MCLGISQSRNSISSRIMISLSVGREERPELLCHQCGAGYPWTESRLSSATELAREMETLSDNEKGILSRSLDDLVRETPNTPVAILRFKQLMAKVGKPAADALKSILVDVIVESAKRQIWPLKGTHGISHSENYRNHSRFNRTGNQSERTPSTSS